MSPGVAPFGCCHKQLPARWAGDRKTVRRADRGLACAQPAGRSRSQYVDTQGLSCGTKLATARGAEGNGGSVLALFVWSC